MPTPDELADALFQSRAGTPRSQRYFMEVCRNELRTLAREAAKQALNEAAENVELPGSSSTGYYASEADSGYAEAERHVEAWLRARAEQIGKDI